MASVKDINVKAFCDEVYTELAGMRMKLLAITEDLSLTYGEEQQPFKSYHRHLSELADQIEWKLQILSHSCPYDWKGSDEKVEKIVSVGERDLSGPDFSGGYIGG